MKIKHLLILMLLALMVPLAVNAQVSFPFDEDFDDNALLGTLPDGWSSSTLAGQGTVEVVLQTNPLRQYLAFTVTGLNNNGRGGVQVQIPTNAVGNWYKAVSFKLMAGVNAGTFSIGYFTTDNTAFPPTQTWTLIATYDASDFTPGTWQPFIVPVAFSDGQTLAFRTNTTTVNTDWAIDDLSISDEGLVPTNLAANASQNSATITWDANLASNWQLQYRVLGEMDWSTSLPATTNSYTLEDLQPGTTYEVRVRARIRPDRIWFYSEYSESFFFTTVAPEAVPYPGLGHDIFSGLHFNMPDIYLPDYWNGTVSPAEAGKIQTHYEAPNPNFPNFKEGWLRMEVTGNPNMNNPVTLTAALPVFDQPVNLLKTRLLIRPSSTVNTYCGNLLLGYITGNDLSTFTTLETYSASGYSTTEYTMVEKVITRIPANARLAICYAANYVNQQNSYWDVDYYMDADGMVSEIIPTNFQLVSSTDTEASFSWDVVTGVTYEIQCKTYDKGKNEWGEWTSLGEVSTYSYTLENLDRRYRYYLRVRVVGYDDQNNPYYGSIYTDEVSVFPGEEMVTEFPYEEHFVLPNGSVYEADRNNLYKLSHQWYYHNDSPSEDLIYNEEYSYGSYYYSYVYKYLPNDSVQDIIFYVGREGGGYDSEPQYAISPKIENLSEKQMTFMGVGRQYGGGVPAYSCPIEVGVMTDPLDISTFELIQTISSGTQTVFFDDFSGGDAHIAFKVPVSERPNYLRLYSVIVEEAPICRPVRNFVVVDGSVTETSIGISWEGRNDTWQLQYRHVASAGDEEPWQSTIINAKQYTITGLSANTHYQVRVRSYCSEHEQGDWSDVLDILTDCSSTFQSIPYCEDFEFVQEGDVPPCWTPYESPVHPELTHTPTVVRFSGENVLHFHNDYSSTLFNGSQSSIYLPKMTNLNHLKIRIKASFEDNNPDANIAQLGIRLCRDINNPYGDGNTIGIEWIGRGDVGIKTYEIYTHTEITEGWIELYTQSEGWANQDWETNVRVFSIEVTEAVQYDKHFTGAISTSWDNYNNWDPVGIPTAEDNVYLNDGLDVIIPANLDAEVNAIDFDSEKTTLTIKDGGSLKFNQGQSHYIGAQNYKILNVTMEKNVQAYTPGKNDHYCLLAVPASNYNDHIIYSLDFFTNDVSDPNYINTDLYTFDPSQELEWRNWKSNALFLNWGYGALYASAVDKQLSFNIRTVVPADFPIDVTQPVNNPNATLYRWALLGNPYTCEAYIRDASAQVVIDDVTQYWYFPYYITNATGDAFVLAPSSRPIKPMEGVFVQGWGTGITHYMFTPEIETPSRGHSFDMTMRKANTRSADVLDRARVQMGEGFDFEHCDIMPNPNRLYIPSGDKQLSVAHAGTIGEMPVNFEAATNGTYTIALEAEDLDFNYLHLIDNLTGTDVDLLQQPEYTFEAKYSDYPSRFKLVFAKGSTEQDDQFAFMREGHLVLFGIEGIATLQVIDMLGHVLSTEQFSGSYDKQLQAASGVYVIRLINGEKVKTQKIVVR